MTQAISATDKDLQHVLVPNALIVQSFSKISLGAIAQSLTEALYTVLMRLIINCVTSRGTNGCENNSQRASSPLPCPGKASSSLVFLFPCGDDQRSHIQFLDHTSSQQKASPTANASKPTPPSPPPLLK